MPRMKILQKPDKPVVKAPKVRPEGGPVRIVMKPAKREKKAPAGTTPREVSIKRRAERAAVRAEKRVADAAAVAEHAAKEFPPVTDPREISGEENLARIAAQRAARGE